jgi:Ca-activated chloride channel homolog
MKRALWTLVAGLTLAGAGWGQAAGLILVHEPDFWRHPPPQPLPPPFVPVPPPRPPRPPSPPVWAPLEVTVDDVDVKIRDQIATTHVEQEFYNPNPRALEGTFLFPLPFGARVDRFTMEINGKPVEAELLRADKARGLYEEIVRKLRDPALLEYAGRDLLKVRIFPIEPRTKKRITLDYSQILKGDDGLVQYSLPLDTDKYSARPVPSLRLKIELESERSLKSIYSPTHSVRIKREDDHRATVTLDASNLKPDADFQLYFAREEGEFGLNLLTQKKEGDEEGYFLLLASPGAELKQSRVIPKDVVFVLDTSGSMAGAKLDQAKKALEFCLANLNDQDRFDLLRFATEAEPLFDKLSPADADHRARAEKFVRDLRPIGGTAIDEALHRALAIRPEKTERPFLVIFLTDGRPTVGNTSEDQIVEGVTKNKESLTRIFCFGIGTDVNTHLLDRITEQTKSFSQYVLPEEDIELKVSNFFTKIKAPVLTNPTITFPESIRASRMYPSPLPDLFKGEQLVLAGRYRGEGDGKIVIAGMVQGESQRFSYQARFPKDSTEHEFIPRLWATRRVGYLLDEIRLHGESQELKDEVTGLARKYGIVTPYTAYLILEDERQRGVAEHRQLLGPEWYGATARRQLSADYKRFSQDRVGDAAIGGARSLNQLKQANAPEAAISLGTEEALRSSGFLNVVTAPSLPGQPVAAPVSAGQPVPMAASRLAQREGARAIAQQSRFVGGRTFYQKGEQWVDAAAQSQGDANPLRIQFNSVAYYELLGKHPRVAPWLALGRQLRFVLDGVEYEIYE